MTNEEKDRQEAESRRRREAEEKKKRDDDHAQLMAQLAAINVITNAD